MFRALIKKRLFPCCLLVLFSFIYSSAEGREGKRQRIKFESGGQYEGEIKNGKPNGQGTYLSPDGRKYVGEFKDGVFSGQGTYTFPDGTKYVGEFEDGKIEGQGTVSFRSGMKYAGEFKEALYNGKGTLTNPDGGKIIGEFKNGQPVTGKCKKIKPDGISEDF
ncbi:MAG: hypothetical protein MRJ65_12960 [Candidatus Brocadiaceae bacterium]|nr:hypothetical protein [Candidatus Brocadiaceae bacterium]